MYLDQILESFNLDPLQTIDSCYDDIHNEFSLLESINFYNSVTTEVITEASNDNIFSKIWNAIKKFFGWIVKKLKSFWHWITGTPSKNGEKSAEQIAYEAGLKAVNDDANAGKFIDINIECDPNSEVQINETIKAQFKLLNAKIDYQRKTLTLTPKTLHKITKEPLKDDFMGNQAVPNVYKKINGCIRFMRDPGLRQQLLNIANAIQDSSISYETIERNKDCIDMWRKTYKITDLNNDTISFDDIYNLYSILNEVNEKLETSDNPETSFINIKDENGIKFINDFCAVAANMQVGIGIIMDACGGSFLIDASYQGTVNDINVLSDFVDRSINSNMSPKYLIRNIYIICHPGLIGKGSPWKPIAGQTRLVIFPVTKKEIVYKIALNGMGVRSNESEINISKLVKEKGKDSMFTLVTDATKDHIIIGMERANTDISMLDKTKDILPFRNKLYALSKELNIPINLSYDTHFGNIGMKNGKLVTIDYGYGRRSTSKDGNVRDIIGAVFKD